MAAAIVVDDLSFAWPDGAAVLTGLDVAIGAGRTGLIGANGAGKSTLLRLIAGELSPDSGTITVTGSVGYLPQTLPREFGRTVADLLGIGPVVRALRAIESGSVDEAHFTAVGDDWDVEARARSQLDQLGLGEVALERTVAEVSGGEAMLIGLAALLLRRPDVLLLDEPTNNLDAGSRQRLYEAVDRWTGVLLTVSHDRALLNRMQTIVELHDDRARSFGGNLDRYTEQRAAEQAAAERGVRAAEGEVRRQRRELIESQTTIDRRARQGRQVAESGSLPKILVGGRKRAAQVSAGKVRGRHEDELAEARAELAEAESAVRREDPIRIDLPATEVPPGRTVLELRHPDLVTVRGPERIGLTGPNGSGKTTVLEAIAAAASRGRAGGTDRASAPSPAGPVVRSFGVPTAYLPQRLVVDDESRSVFDLARRAAPGRSANEIRAGLARLLFRAGRADQPIAQLSGGERFRAVLASLLLADPAPQLLLLDEPTNSLDLASVSQLVEALGHYRGVLIVASHDQAFLDELALDRWWLMDKDQGLVDVTRP